jgi:ABC-2 type transport system permease protein
VSRDDAVRLLAGSHSKLALVVEFPSDFSRRLERSRATAPGEAQVNFLVDPAGDSGRLETVERLIRVDVMAAAAATAAVDDGATLAVGPAGGDLRKHDAALARELKDPPRVLFERTAPSGAALPPPLKPEEQNVPGYTIFGIFFIVQIIGGTLLREKEGGTFTRLRAAPIPRAVILLGKLVPFYAVNMVQLLFMLALGHFVFGIGLGHSPLGLLAITLATAAVANALGLFVAAVSKTTEQMGPLSGIILITFATVGGIFVPAYDMPWLLQKLSVLTPHAWALKGIQDVIVRGGQLSTVLPTAAVLLGFAGFFYALALLRFRFD